jgi:phosphatidylglycerol:prolipoprotein diacylglycerol transferase
LGLYEVIWSAAAIGLVLWLGKRKLPRGFFMALIPMFYAPVRFGLDYLREIPLHGGDVRYFGFTPGQYGSIAMFIAGALVAIRIARGPAATIYLDGTDGPAPAAAEPAKPSPKATGKKKRAR